MSDGAVHLVQEVFPRVPVRHWVCSFPWGVRSVLGYHKGLCRDAVSAFAKELSRSLKRRAKAQLGLPRMSEALTGSVCVVQRTDGALRLNVHLHVLALDGVYTEEEGGGDLTFHALPTPTATEVAEIAQRTARRLHRAFQKVGRASPWDDDGAGDEFSDAAEADQPGLFACYQAAAAGVGVSGERAGQPPLRLVVSPGAMTSSSLKPEAEAEGPVATALGVNLFAKQVVDGRDRAQLERLCRYVVRPPLSQERLEWRPDGRLLLTLKNVWKDGTHALTLEPHDLLVRLCAAIPPPWFNMTRYFGVLSSHSKHRSRVVPGGSDPERFEPPAAKGDQLQLGLELSPISECSNGNKRLARQGKRSRWGWLLRHVFRADVETCSHCGGPLRWVQAARDPPDIQRLLRKHGLAREPKARCAPALVGQLSLPL